MLFVDFFACPNKIRDDQPTLAALQYLMNHNTISVIINYNFLIFVMDNICAVVSFNLHFFTLYTFEAILLKKAGRHLTSHIDGGEKVNCVEIIHLFLLRFQIGSVWNGKYNNLTPYRVV